MIPSVSLILLLISFLSCASFIHAATYTYTGSLSGALQTSAAITIIVDDQADTLTVKPIHINNFPADAWFYGATYINHGGSNIWRGPIPTLDTNRDTTNQVYQLSTYLQGGRSASTFISLLNTGSAAFILNFGRPYPQQCYNGCGINGFLRLVSTTYGDPQFVGFQGQNYQVHGIPDTWFNIISSPQLYFNGRFAYLASGVCNYNNTQCWTHPGTYIDDIGITLFCNNNNVTSDRNPNITTSNAIRVRISSGVHSDGIKYLSINDKYSVDISSKRLSLCPGNNDNDDKFWLVHPTHDTVILSSELFTITFVNSDQFFNMQTQFNDHTLLKIGRKRHSYIQQQDHQHPHPQNMKYTSHDNDMTSPYPSSIFIHGLLGQTWKNALYKHKSQTNVYEGQVDDYITDGPWDVNSFYAHL